jgi:hypothetical protein
LRRYAAGFDTGDEAASGPEFEHERISVADAHIVGRGRRLGHGFETAIRGYAVETHQRRRNKAEGGRRIEARLAGTQRMPEYDAVQLAPAVVVLVAGIGEGRCKGIRG